MTSRNLSQLRSIIIRSSSIATIDGVVEEGADVVDEEGVQEFSDFFFVGEVEGAVVGDPDAFQVHWADFDYVFEFLALENTVSSSAGHACYVEELGAVDHMVIFTSSNASTLDINLEAECRFVLPQCSGNSRLHANRSDLTRCIHALRSLEVIILSALLDMCEVHGW